MIVSQIMTRNVETCRPGDSLAVAAGRMWDHDIGCLPVLDGEGHVIGMITDRDACMAAYTQGLALNSISVESAMARTVFSCLPTDRVDEVESVMRLHRIRRVPIIDPQGHLLGIVSANDVVRESARELRKKNPDVAPGPLVSALAAICEPRRPTIAAAQ
ncbi:MAG TPA: CBS domain-containing protein [Polyangiaceae bacterium]|nr:CBS domain-containing protein [Polyangiaceae bacterium]